MFVQASIYNRSWFRSWLKLQLVKVLILIVLIVPLIAVVLEDNKEAAAENDVHLSSPQQEAARASIQKFLKSPGILVPSGFSSGFSVSSGFSGPLTLQPPGKSPSEFLPPVEEKIREIPLLPKSPLQGQAPKKISIKESVREKSSDFLFTPAELLQKRVETIKQLVYPRKDESEESTRDRKERTVTLLWQNGFADIKDPQLWQLITIDMIQEGFLSEAAFVMHEKPNFFYQHDRKDFAFSHAAVAQFVKKSKRDYSDYSDLNRIWLHSDCSEWAVKGMVDKILESCHRMRDVRIDLVKKAEKIDPSVFDSVARVFKTKVAACNKDPPDFIKNCIAV